MGISLFLGMVWDIYSEKNNPSLQNGKIWPEKKCPRVPGQMPKCTNTEYMNVNGYSLRLKAGDGKFSEKNHNSNKTGGWVVVPS